jgi:DNA-binding MarR family transcriptional regulator
MDIGIGGRSPIFATSMLTPGSLIRRLNQIHIALFAEEAAGLDITPVQLSVMSAVARHSGRDQSAIAEEIGVDRATLASVAARLEKTGLIRRTPGRKDQRQKLLHLTSRGRSILNKMQKPVKQANERTLAPLTPAEQEMFLSLLSILVDGGNVHARAKLRLPTTKDSA